eukprot:Selendium_serpulae@DN2380_c0_g1_i5.p1
MATLEPSPEAATTASPRSGPDDEFVTRSPFVKLLKHVDQSDSATVGGKAAHLGEIMGLFTEKGATRVPVGYVICCDALDFFLETNNLKEKIRSLLSPLLHTMGDNPSKAIPTAELEKTSQAITDLFLSSPLPPQLLTELIDAQNWLTLEFSSADPSQRKQHLARV